MKMVSPKKNRIKDKFFGTIEGRDVTFKFTYSWDLDKQVEVISEGVKSVISLEQFHTYVTPETRDVFFVSTNEKHN